ncbi:MAG: FG-GAP-like repeat-containing protein [Thiohalocapsa sp.]|nr:FG-GAP-like repeat-containing protein [Thiohalocapsa sp.]
MSTTAVGAIQFENVSATAGPFPVTESWGATAADMNADGWIDIFYNAHRQRPYIFRNDGDGGFTDVTLRVDRSSTWVEFPGDQHAGTWADYDNDGDQDLMVSTGINVDAQFFVNQGGYFTDEAIAYGAGAFTAAGRAAFWLDFSGDGYSDLLMTTFNPANVYEQTPLVAFNKNNVGTGFACGSRNNHVHFNDFNVDGKADLLCMREASVDTLWDISDFAETGGPFVDITASLPGSSLVADSASADFDNNGEIDLLIVRGRLRLQEAVLHSADRIEVRVEGGDGSGTGFDSAFDFEGGEEIYVDISSEQFGRWRTFIGSGAVRPAEEGPFTLSSTDPVVHGISTFDPVFGRSIHIGYDTTLSQWQVRVYYGPDDVRAYFMIDRLTGPDFANLTFAGTTNGDGLLPPHLYMNNGGTFTNEPWPRGLGDPIHCASAGVGDFDNDMDVDIYMVCRGGAQNIANRLYENDGTGNFTLVPGAGGAEGPLGTAVADGVGIGDSVVVADFDADGFLDLFTVNGLNLQPSRVGGPAELHRNLGNGNSWIQIDLEGTVSNRDGLGAKVYVTTPDAKTQLREQDGGYHRWSQNAKRLHVGLGSNSVISTLRVEWPGVGGVVNVNEFYNINIGQGGIYRVTEGTTGIGSGVLTPVTLGVAAGDVPPQPGDECGETDPNNPNPLQEPWYSQDFGPAILVWKDCSTNAWHLRTKGGQSETTVSYQGRLRSTVPFTSIAGFDVDAFDSFEVVSQNEATFNLNVIGVNEDGIDFEVPTGSQCLELDTPVDQPILIGAGRWAADAPLDLQTMQGCSSTGNLSVDVADAQAFENDGTVDVEITLSAPPAAGESVDVSFATADATALAGADYAAASGTVTFAAGEISKTATVTLLDDSILEGSETFFVEITSITGALPGDASGEVSIIDDEGIACGEPSYDAGTEAGLFVWRDCDAAGPDQTWSARVTAGGSGTVVEYGGVISSDAALSATGFSIEGADEVNVVAGDVSYVLFVKGTGQDGVNLTVPAGESACFGAETLPAGAVVEVGVARTPVTVPFDLATLESCAPAAVPTMNIGDLTVDENAGTASVQVTLSESASGDVTASFATADGTALAGFDYTASSGTVTFTGGSTSETISIPITNDSDVEGLEDFTVTLTNPVGALAGDMTATVTIEDDEGVICGEPSYNAASEIGLFVWRDCDAVGPDAVWHARVTAGGNPVVQEYGGMITSDAVLSATGFSIEGADVVSVVGGNVTYSLFVKNAGQDGIDSLVVPAGETACFGADLLPSGAVIEVGSSRTPVTAPFDLNTLQSCAPVSMPTMSIADLTVDENAGTASVQVTLSESASGDVTASFATADGTALAGSDYTASSGTVTFTGGSVSETIVISITNDADVEGAEDFTVTLSNLVGAAPGDLSATVTILDDDGGNTQSCGEPALNQSTDRGFFMWRDCTVPGDQNWTIRALAGGSASTIAFGGSITSSATLTVTPDRLEANDTLAGSGTGLIDYEMLIINTGLDGAFLTVPEGETACVTVDALPAGAVIEVGAGREPVTTPFDLETLGSCAPASQQSMGISDVTVDEGAGTAVVEVVLSSPTGVDASADFATADGSATAGSDYSATSGTVTFTNSATTETIVVPITDDNDEESDESFTVTLSNIAGAAAGATSATVTIVDNDGASNSLACGEPSYSAGNDAGLFIWRDCAAAGDQQWYVRAASGGSSQLVEYSGTITSTAVLGATGFNLEVADTLSPIADGWTYSFFVKNWGQDGIDPLTVPAGETACFGVDMLPAGAVVAVGADRTPVSAPFDLATLGACQ